MFERFTEPARRVIILAQEESRLAGHADVDTDHILLGLIAEGSSVAAKVLTEDNGLELHNARERMLKLYRSRLHIPGSPGSPGFTVSAKDVLEGSLREALQLGYNTIVPEHILLAMIRIGGQGRTILQHEGIDPSVLRQQVIKRLSGYGAPAAAPPEKPSDQLLAVIRAVSDVRPKVDSILDKTVVSLVDRALKELDLAAGAQLLRERRARSL